MGCSYSRVRCSLSHTRYTCLLHGHADACPLDYSCIPAHKMSIRITRTCVRPQCVRGPWQDRKNTPGRARMNRSNDICPCLTSYICQIANRETCGLGTNVSTEPSRHYVRLRFERLEGDALIAKLNERNAALLSRRRTMTSGAGPSHRCRTLLDLRRRH